MTFKYLRTYSDILSADLDKAILQGNGIDAFLEDEHTGRRYAAVGIKLIVPEDQWNAADKILSDIQRKKDNGQESDA